MTVGLFVLLSYLIGSIPTAIIVSKYIFHKDVRKYGSKNAGATNVFRVLGWKPGLSVLMIDIFKGFVITFWLAKYFSLQIAQPQLIYIQLIGGIAAVFGHIWTIFAKFKGGKGVATGAGMLIGIMPTHIFIAVIIFLIVVAISKIVSLGSILAALSIPLSILVLNGFTIGENVPIFVFSIFIFLLILYTHRSNVKRLLHGEENKIQFRKG